MRKLVNTACCLTPLIYKNKSVHLIAWCPMYWKLYRAEDGLLILSLFYFRPQSWFFYLVVSRATFRTLTPCSSQVKSFSFFTESCFKSKPSFLELSNFSFLLLWSWVRENFHASYTFNMMLIYIKFGKLPHRRYSTDLTAALSLLHFMVLCLMQS